MRTDSIIKSISKANHMFNETLTIHSSSEVDCTSCSYDPIAKESTDINCPVCSGNGKIITEVKTDIPVSLEYYNSGDSLNTDVNRLKGGIYDDSLILVTIDIEEINEYSIDISKIDYYTWRDTNYRLKSKEFGILTEIYELNIVLEKVI